jgi:hypothetical protein
MPRLFQIMRSSPAKRCVIRRIDCQRSSWHDQLQQQHHAQVQRQQSIATPDQGSERPRLDGSFNDPAHVAWSAVIGFTSECMVCGVRSTSPVAAGKDRAYAQTAGDILQTDGG